MRKKLFSVVGVIFLLLVFVNSVSAASLDVLDVNTTVDKDTYQYDETILSNIDLSNISETNKAENIRVNVEFPEELKLVETEGLTVDGNNITWQFDQIDVLENEEVSFKTVLPKPEIGEANPEEDDDVSEEGEASPEEDNNESDEDEANSEEGDNASEEETDEGVVIIPSEDDDDLLEDAAVTGSVDETKPQTGDESSIATYIYILIASIVLVTIALVGLYRKKIAKTGFTALVLLILSSAFIINGNEANAESAVYEQSISHTYSVEVEGKDYEFEVTVTAEVPNEIIEIDADPSEITLNPGGFESFELTGTKTSGDVEDLVEDDHLSFNISDAEKVEVKVGDEGLEVHATDAAEAGDEITVTAVYDVNGEEVTTSITVTITEYQGTLKGQVFDAITEETIEGATVEITAEDGSNITVQTNSNGEYETDISAGTHVVKATADGYIAESETVNITADETTTSDLNLYLVSEEHAGEGTASGTITDALTGEGVPNVEISVVKGKNNSSGEVIDTITTDEAGYYSVELPGGNYTLLLSAEGYVSTTKNIVAIGDREKPNQNATITPELEEEEMRIVLTWGEEPSDLDSHLTGPKADGGRFHIYWNNKVYEDAETEVNLDRDDVSSFGPETITVINQITDGTYKYNVFNYSGWQITESNKKDLAKSSAKVEVYKGNNLIQTYNVPTNIDGNMWKVFEIVDGEIKTINKIETYEEHPNVDNQ